MPVNKIPHTDSFNMKINGFEYNKNAKFMQ